MFNIFSQDKKRKFKNKALKITYFIFLYAFLIGMAYVLLYPILIMLSKAFRPVEDMLNPNIIWISSRITFDNFKVAVLALEYFPTLVKTLRITLINTVLAMISCSMAGYGISRFKLKLKPLFVIIMILSILVPIQTYVIPMYYDLVYFDFFGIGSLIGLFTGEALTVNLVNNEIVFYIINALGVGLRSGLFVLIFMRFFAGLPKELESAARIDGCNELKIFLKVMLPNMGSAYLVVFLFSFVWNWNDYYYSNLLMRSSALLSTKLSQAKELVTSVVSRGTWGSNADTLPTMFAASILVILPPLIIYAVLQRGFVQSFERSGIVG